MSNENLVQRNVSAKEIAARAAFNAFESAGVGAGEVEDADLLEAHRAIKNYLERKNHAHPNIGEDIINYGAPEPARGTSWRSLNQSGGLNPRQVPPLHYDEARGGWTVFGREPVPQWHELPETSFPLIKV